MSTAKHQTNTMQKPMGDAAERVFALPELLEMILTEVAATDLTTNSEWVGYPRRPLHKFLPTCRGVSKTFKAAIDGTEKGRKMLAEVHAKMEIEWGEDWERRQQRGEKFMRQKLIGMRLWNEEQKLNEERARQGLAPGHYWANGCFW